MPGLKLRNNLIKAEQEKGLLFCGRRPEPSLTQGREAELSERPDGLARRQGAPTASRRRATRASGHQNHAKRGWFFASAVEAQE
jgi:hypothetical protein